MKGEKEGGKKMARSYFKKCIDNLVDKRTEEEGAKNEVGRPSLRRHPGREIPTLLPNPIFHGAAPRFRPRWPGRFVPGLLVLVAGFAHVYVLALQRGEN